MWNKVVELPKRYDNDLVKVTLYAIDPPVKMSPKDCILCLHWCYPDERLGVEYHDKVEYFRYDDLGFSHFVLLEDIWQSKEAMSIRTLEELSTLFSEALGWPTDEQLEKYEVHFT